MINRSERVERLSPIVQALRGSLARGGTIGKIDLQSQPRNSCQNTRNGITVSGSLVARVQKNRLPVCSATQSRILKRKAGTLDG